MRSQYGGAIRALPFKCLRKIGPQFLAERRIAPLPLADNRGSQERRNRPTSGEAVQSAVASPGNLWQLLLTNANEGRSMPDEILTLLEVAQLLKVAEKTVYTMTQQGDLPAFKVRGQWRFKREDLDQWIEQQKVASGDRIAHGKTQ